MKFRTIARVSALAAAGALLTAVPTVAPTAAVADDPVTPLLAPLASTVDLSGIQSLVDGCTRGGNANCDADYDLAGNALGVGSVVAQLVQRANTCDLPSGITAVGTFSVPDASGLDLAMRVDEQCRLVVTGIANSVANVDTGVGVTPIPETADDVIVDTNGVVDLDANTVQAQATTRRCSHQGWSKTTTDTGAGGGFPGFHTNAEVRIQSTWTSTGTNGTCEGASISNMVFTNNSKYSYCYANGAMNFTTNLGCTYAISKGAPYGSYIKIDGDFDEGTYTPDDYFRYHLYSKAVATKNLKFGNLCWTSDSVPPDTEMHCAGKRDF